MSIHFASHVVPWPEVWCPGQKTKQLCLWRCSAFSLFIFFSYLFLPALVRHSYLLGALQSVFYAHFITHQSCEVGTVDSPFYRRRAWGLERPVNFSKFTWGARNRAESKPRLPGPRVCPLQPLSVMKQVEQFQDKWYVFREEKQNAPEAYGKGTTSCLPSETPLWKGQLLKLARGPHGFKRETQGRGLNLKVSTSLQRLNPERASGMNREKVRTLVLEKEGHRAMPCFL